MDAKQAEPWTAEENALNKIIPYSEMQPEQLLEMANDAADQVERRGRETVQHAIVAGRSLLEAKRQTPHGEWMAFLKSHWNRSVRHAQNYMTLANTQHASHLDQAGSVRAALAMIASESEPEPDTTPEPVAHSEPIEITASEPPEPRQPSVSVKKPREPKEAPAERLAESEPFALGERLDADRTEILAMSGDYAIAKKLPHFVVMLRKVAADLEGSK